LPKKQLITWRGIAAGFVFASFPNFCLGNFRKNLPSILCPETPPQIRLPLAELSFPLWPNRGAWPWPHSSYLIWLAHCEKMFSGANSIRNSSWRAHHFLSLPRSHHLADTPADQGNWQLSAGQ